MHRGYIKLWRKIMEWEWYKDSNAVHLFLHLLMTANHKTSRYMGHEIKRGQLVAGRKQLSIDTGISQQSIRTSLERLKSTNEITSRSTNRFTIVTICNFETYQCVETSFQPAIQPDDQPATNQQLTTSKECKNEKNKEVCAAQSQTDAPPAKQGAHLTPQQLELNLGVSVTTAAQDDAHAVSVPAVAADDVIVTGPKQWDVMYRLPQHGKAEAYFEEAIWWYNGMPDTYRMALLNDFKSINVRAEVAASLEWLKCNPHKRRTFPHKFLRDWLRREVKKQEAKAKYAAYRN